MKQKLKMGMVGGGIGAFIGDVHRKAAALDGIIELVGGAFSSKPEKSKKSGELLGLDPERVYGNYEEMILRERKLPEGERMDFISIVTPNFMHFTPARGALKYGFDVICDKPVTFSLEEAQELESLIRDTGRIFALTHNYTGYPMVRQARHLVSSGELGAVRKVVVEYLQGWLSTKLEDEDQKQASWRTDPHRSGAAGCMGDIGTHAENLAEFVTGLRIESLCADLTRFVPGRQLDDDGNVLLRFEGGAKGTLVASQIAAGEENNLTLRVYGEKGSVTWSQMEPNSLIVRWLNKPMEILRTGYPGLCKDAEAHTRIPAGHPEGYLEAFANIYRNFAHHLLAGRNRTAPNPYFDFPTIQDGIRGMRFIQRVVESSERGAVWVDFND